MKEIAFKIIMAGVTCLAPIHTLIFLITCAILIDTWFGRWAAAHEARRLGVPVREFVTSNRTRKGVISKFIGYNVALIMMFCLDKYLLQEILLWILPGVPVAYLCTKIVGLIILWIEFDSVDEKWFRVKGVTLKSQIISRIKILKGIYTEIKKSSTHGTGPNDIPPQSPV
jgi:hypothetical protein